jgi:lipopolysaccharide/colanic/teichoic acid biosynthesis glycosyltransferase
MRRREILKRATDLVVSSMLLVMTAPLQAATAVAIRATMGAPVLFRQSRAGQRGHPFTLWKFRTMSAPVAGRTGPEWDGDRLTALGRFLRGSSLDELPSLWNVIRGDMSLVGPRPLLLRYVDRYTEAQARRLLVRPGITGWAQVNGRNGLAWDEKFRLDCWYVEHRTWSLDLRILMRTVAVVFRREGISFAATSTMPEFRGVDAP